MNRKKNHYLYRKPYASPQEKGAPPPVYSRSVENGMVIERNVTVKMRDGIELYADVFRPDNGIPVPPIIAWTPYGKHQNGIGIFSVNPGCGVTPGMVSPYATFEGPDPAYWVPQGYAVINVDIRGLWYCGGVATLISPEEAEDFYDCIEWAGTRDWSNGKVGLSGVSYLAVTQWRVAALHPPHLAAINPWEGWTDTYRELATHGGIPDSWFWPERLAKSWGTSRHDCIEDIVAERDAHPFYDEFWKTKTADLIKITVPAFVVACWADQGLHLRGTLEGFKHIASEHKYLEVHGRKKWAHYYHPDSVKRLQDFFDHYLKGISTAVATWPRVRLEVRERLMVGEMQREKEWPIARTQYTKLYLDAANNGMQRQPVKNTSSFSYDAMASGPGVHRACFEMVFEEPVDLIGHMKLKVFMAATDAEDMDIFVGVYKFDRDGKWVPFAYYSFFDDGPVALGWLRASHRELDEERSTEYQPVHTHQREQKLKPGDIVPLDIELWPSGTRFAKGERLRLIIQGSDLQKYSRVSNPIYFRHDDTVNSGRHVVYTGGENESYLLVPVVPEE